MRAENVGDVFVKWAKETPHVRVLLMIGSRTRRPGDCGCADEKSDWDFQVATSEGRLFLDSRWVAEAGLGKPLAYVARIGRLGTGTKVSVVLDGGELDIVVISSFDFRMLGLLYKYRLLKWSPKAIQGARSLSSVWSGGVAVLKGSKEVGRFVNGVRRELGVRRLDDDTILSIAEGFVCDYVSTRRKLDRGEIVAAQRWLHVQLGEANLALLHELRQRVGKISFPDGRRVESYLPREEIGRISLEATLDRRSMASALYRSANTFKLLAEELLKGRWHWPELPSSLRVEELRDDVL